MRQLNRRVRKLRRRLTKRLRRHGMPTVRQLGRVIKNPKRHAATSTMRVRQWYWYLFAALNLPELVKRKRLARELDATPGLPAVPEDAGFLVIDSIRPDLVDGVVHEARAILRETDLAALEASQGGAHLIGVPLQHRLDVDGPIWRFASNPDLLKIVSDYMGMFPVVDGIHLMYSPNRANLAGTSQYLHLDGQDVKTVKVWVHIEDVNEDNGPLTIIPARESGRLARELNYRKSGSGKRITDEVASNMVDPAVGFHQFVGEAGSVYLVDTDRCLHFGSRKATQPRFVMGFYYISPFAFSLPPRDWRGALSVAPNTDGKQLGPHERPLVGVE